MADNQSDPDQDARSDEGQDRPRVIDAEELFQGGREVWIEHEGVRYRLRITRRNKLILQK
jgi:hemin uptake protein HemP